MKIAVLVYSLDKIGGIAKHALHLSRALTMLGHDVDVWSVEYNPELCYPELAGSFEVNALRPANMAENAPSKRGFGIGTVINLWTLWKFYLDQQRLWARIPAGYDIIHPHGHMVSWAATAYKHRYLTPVVWLCNDFGPIASHHKATVPTMLKKIEHYTKKIITCPFTFYDRTAVRSIDKIAVLSESVQSKMKDYYGVDSSIVRAGVDFQAFLNGDEQDMRARYAVPGNAFLLLTVSMLMPRRRLEDVIQAVRILVNEGRNITYLIVGRTSHNPAYTQYVQREIANCNLGDRVKFVGEVVEEDLAAYYHACDAFVWASDENQSWGLAGMEAMAAGKPVIVSKANGLAEVLQDEKTALLVTPRSPQAVADAVRRLMEDQTLKESIARQGQQLVREKYSWRKHAEEMLDLFNEARTKCSKK